MARSELHLHMMEFTATVSLGLTLSIHSFTSSICQGTKCKPDVDETSQLGEAVPDFGCYKLRPPFAVVRGEKQFPRRGAKLFAETLASTSLGRHSVIMVDLCCWYCSVGHGGRRKMVRYRHEEVSMMV